MKRLLLIGISILLALPGYSQSACNPNFTWQQQPGPVNPLQVNFTNTSSFTPPSGNPNLSPSYNINFGDNYSASFSGSTTITHSYSVPGSYIVVLTMNAYDSVNHAPYCASNDTQTVTVAYPPCWVDVATQYIGNAQYVFTANNPAGSTGLSYSWNFGDGSTGTGNPVTHTYLPGNYVASVTVTGPNCTDTKTFNFTAYSGTLNCANMHASFYPLPQGNNSFYFINSSTPHFQPSVLGMWSTWDFGDGSPLVVGEAQPLHTYAASGNYLVTLFHQWIDTATFNVLCSDTQTMMLYTGGPNNQISGFVTYDSTTFTTPLNFKVWLIEEGYDSATSSVTLTAIDSLITSSAGYFQHYSFNNKPSGDYYIKAYVAPSMSNPGLIPTYHQSSAVWTGATQINHYGYATYKQIHMLQGTPTSGPGFIGGNVSQGAGKGTSTGIANQLILLRDGNNKVITFTYTDINGDYGFGTLPAGTYTIYPEEMNYQTTPSAALVVGAGTNTYNYVDFEKNSTTIKPKTTAVNDVVNVLFSIYPNPSRGQVNVSWKAGIKGNAQIAVTDIAGRMVYKTEAITTATAQINLSRLNPGIYFIKVNTNKGQHTEKILLQ